MQSCCTCTALLPPANGEPAISESEKPLPENRRLECCDRIICGRCIHNNSRFADYCPYCQVSTAPSALPPRLREPPPYTSVPRKAHLASEVSCGPPPYIYMTGRSDEEKATMAEPERHADDILHFLDHDHDTISSLSLRYGVPIAALRRANNITSDNLLTARRTVVIPGEFYKGGVSLSPRPVEGEEEELRKNKIRRFMVSCKVSDYSFALSYLEQSNFDLPAAIEAYMDDEAWERQHSQRSSNKTKSLPRPYRDRGRLWN